jgi:hypothetical protein
MSKEERYLRPQPNTGAMPMSDNPFTDMHTLAKNNLSGQAEQINLYLIREYGLSSIVKKTQGSLFRDREHC